MLNFDDDFFCEEEREGFVVSKTMKHAWAAQMEILDQVDKVMKKYNLQYFAFWGTLLGCIRHDGFIPWDDDVDIAMKREEYNKFIAVAEREFPPGCVVNMYTNEEYPMTFTRVTNGNKLNMSEEWMTQYHGCPFPVGIDVFPLDHLPEEADQIENQKNILFMISNMGTVLGAINGAEELSPEEKIDYGQVLDEGLQMLESLCGVRLSRSQSNLSNRLHRLFDTVCATYTEEQGHIVTSMLEHTQGKGFYLQKEWLDDVCYRKFECMELPVPICYEKVLEALYGDWRVPVRGTADHEYPFYKSTLEQLWKQGILLDMKL